MFAENLNAPYGMALVGNQLYVANQDALVRFDYRDGQTRASGPPVKVTDLPSQMNHHWTKSLAASPDGRFLYVGIGSNSNITERGMLAEVDRAQIWQVDAKTGAHRAFATGTRNPTALAIQPGTGQLWAVANERDEIGPDLVPDYLTSMQGRRFYGWPYSYWGQNVDTRVQPQDPQLVASAISSRLQPGIARRRARRRLLGAGDGRQVRRGRVRRRARQLEPADARRLQGGVRALQQRPSVRTAGRRRSTGFMGDDGKTRGRPVGVTVDPPRRPDRRRRSVEHDLAGDGGQAVAEGPARASIS